MNEESSANSSQGGFSEAFDEGSDADAENEGDVREIHQGELGRGTTATPDDQTTKILRLQADFDNFRRRNAAGRQEGRDEARREMLARLLPVYDNFVRALTQAEQSPELASFLEGFEMILRQLQDFFREQGLEVIESSPGTLFDPNVHEAAGAMPTSDHADDSTIGAELQKGFTYKGVVIRPSSVMVYTAS